MGIIFDEIVNQFLHITRKADFNTGIVCLWQYIATYYEYVDKKYTTSLWKCGTNRKYVDAQIYKYN